MTAIDVDRVRAALPLAPTAAVWFDTWDAVAVDGPTTVPSADEARDLLLRLGADPIDADACAAARPDPDEDPALWWVLERCHWQLAATMGEPDMILWPPMPFATGDKGRFVYVYALLSAIPRTLAHYRSRGVDEDVLWETLRNIGEKLRLNRARLGVPGCAVAFWFTLHLRGSLFRLGRLEFAIERVPEGAAAAIGTTPGALRLGVHIPGEGGPMTREACAESFRRADDFAARHLADLFPEPPTMTCSSWLLDPQLREPLGTGSNIVAFQDFFTLTPPGPNAAADGRYALVQFVFHSGIPDPADLRDPTRLERVLAEGVAAGVEWRERTGVVRRPLPTIVRDPVRRNVRDRRPTLDDETTFRIDAMSRTDTASRVVAAPTDRVFAALVDADSLVEWLPPEGMTGRFVHFDPRPGGSYRLILTYVDATGAPGKATAETDVVEARFVEIAPGERVVQAVDFASDDPAFAGTMTMTWEVEAMDAATSRVTIRAEDVPVGVDAEAHAVGLASSLANLAAHVER